MAAFDLSALSYTMCIRFTGVNRPHLVYIPVDIVLCTFYRVRPVVVSKSELCFYFFIYFITMVMKKNNKNNRVVWKHGREIKGVIITS